MDGFLSFVLSVIFGLFWDPASSLNHGTRTTTAAAAAAAAALYYYVPVQLRMHAEQAGAGAAPICASQDNSGSVKMRVSFTSSTAAVLYRRSSSIILVVVGNPNNSANATQLVSLC